jgi:hypothetical protein
LLPTMSAAGAWRVEEKLAREIRGSAVRAIEIEAG